MGTLAVPRSRRRKTCRRGRRDGDGPGWHEVSCLVVGWHSGAAGKMASEQVTALDIGLRTLDKASFHGITEAQLQTVIMNSHVLIRNRKQRAASHILIGRDNQGRCLAVPVIPTQENGRWRVVTAWYCKPSEAARLREETASSW